nr:putative inactive disease susceptibility protein LOV1 [Coffea arabica]
MEEQDLKQRLYQDLQEKCYLVVLDDVWKKEAWDCLAWALPDVSRSSRLLLTSRNTNIPLHVDGLSIPYELKALGKEDSWKLFLKKAFSNGANSGCPLDLENVGREIARWCAGLPLAITVLGGLLLSKKKMKSEWEKVLNNISTYLSRGQNGGVSTILE